MVRQFAYYRRIASKAGSMMKYFVTLLLVKYSG
jgi:hypothetical protein